MQYNRSFVFTEVSACWYTAARKDQCEQRSLQKSLPYRNQGLSGRFTYSYDSRYMAELNFGYNGSERFYKNDVGDSSPRRLAWVISNEKFWRPMNKVNP